MNPAEFDNPDLARIFGAHIYPSASEALEAAKLECVERMRDYYVVCIEGDTWGFARENWEGRALWRVEPQGFFPRPKVTKLRP